ncbi:unnamed protein product [Boreogadus saida]
MTVRTALSSAPPRLSGKWKGKCKPDDNTASDPALIIRPIITGGRDLSGEWTGEAGPLTRRLFGSTPSTTAAYEPCCSQTSEEEDNLVSTVLCRVDWRARSGEAPRGPSGA